MNNKTVELINNLFVKVSDIKLNEASGIFGTTSKHTILDNLRKATLELLQSIKDDQTYEEVMRKQEALVGAIDTSGITGLISESEIESYYKLADDIWSEIEKERKK